MRAGMVEAWRSDYVRTARAKGLTRRRIVWRHVARNAILPTLTIAGVLFGELLAGAVVTEAVFGLSGLGGLSELSREPDAEGAEVLDLDVHHPAPLDELIDGERRLLSEHLAHIRALLSAGLGQGGHVQALGFERLAKPREHGL
jgi:hypothetical protein